MNVSPAPASLAPPMPPPPHRPVRSGRRRIADILLGKVATLVLAAIALLLGIATFAVLAGDTSAPFGPNRMFGLVLANLVALLLLGAALAGRLTRVWMERRRGSAGARLHVRLVMLFSGVAVTPAIVVAIFATAFFHYGIQAWFNDPVQEAINESLQVSRGYLEEHRDNI
ncbi:MAG: sensor histidine kinase NtrY-like, partial [Acetobacteraceae bacterium]